MDRKELLIVYTKRLWMANTANDITGLLLDYEKDLKLIEEREQVKNCSTPDVERSTFRFDVENWGLGTLLYAYCLYWITIVGLINLGVYLLS